MATKKMMAWSAVMNEGMWTPYQDNLLMTPSQAAVYCKQKLARMNACFPDGTYSVTAIKVVFKTAPCMLIMVERGN